MDIQTSPYLLISSFVSQQLFDFLYKHPDVKWVNKGTVLQLSAGVSALAALAIAWASGTLDLATTQGAVDAVWNAIYGAIAPIAMYEIMKLWSLHKPPFIARLLGAPHQIVEPTPEVVPSQENQ